MRAFSLLLIVAVAGCASESPKNWTRLDGPSFPPTDPAGVRVLEKKPDSALVIGQVHAIHGERTTALDEAKKRAAAIGADAIVRLAKGDEIEMWPYSPWSTEFVEAEALRLR